MPYYERHLPHWQPEGAVLFLTWRLHGSLPKVISKETLRSVDQELDRAATGPRWLQDAAVAQCVVEALHYGEERLHLYELRAWVVMINHVHLLISPAAELSRITKAIKNYSARQANAILGRTGEPFWQDESYDHGVRDPKELEKIVLYIDGNPVSAGLVERAEDWRCSIAFRE